jgi:hypothetical protein
MGTLLLASLLSGCFIQSFQPFYTDEVVVDLPSIIGEWMMVKMGDRDVTKSHPQPWVFRDGEVTTFDENIDSILKVKYFRVKKITFIDLFPSDPDKTKGPNGWWAIHTIPVHSVCKVELSGNTLIITPLNGSWVKKMLKGKEISLSNVVVGTGDQIALTTSSSELVQFLEKYGSNASAFPTSESYLFKRKTNNDIIERSSS